MHVDGEANSYALVSILILVSSPVFVPALENEIPVSTQGCIQGFNVCLSHHAVKEKLFCLPEYDTIVMHI